MTSAFGCALVTGVLVFTSIMWLMLRSKPAAAHNYRMTPRFPVRTNFEVIWEDESGQGRAATARVRDLSEAGAGLIVSKPLALDSFVSVLGREYRLSGGAYVRHCTRKGFSYLVGLEFKGPLVRSI